MEPGEGERRCLEWHDEHLNQAPRFREPRKWQLRSLQVTTRRLGASSVHAVREPLLMEKAKRNALVASVKPLASLSAVFLYLAEAGHDRLTINQAAFFLLAAAADARGKPLTLTELLETVDGSLGKSIANSYKALLEPRGRDPKDFSLGWLEREPDPDDERRNYLRLTAKGAEVAMAALTAVGLGEA